jgi:hypothetical protein
MLIVYQSMESTRNFFDTGTTVITGNSFKRKVQKNLLQNPEMMKNVEKIKDRVWDEMSKTTQFITRLGPDKIATEQEHDDLFKSFKKMDEEEAFNALKWFLAEVIDGIAVNTSLCTKGKGSVNPAVRLPDVLGEIYGSNLMGLVIGEYVVTGGMNPTKNAQHRFTVLMRTGMDGKTSSLEYEEDVKVFYFSQTDTKLKDTLAKCMMIRVRGWLIAFVHVPNKICNVEEDVAAYLDNNAKSVGGDEAKLDLVMGDTNQKSSAALQQYMNDAYNRRILKARKKTTEKEVPKWGTSISGKTQIVRGYTNYEVSGTNSNYKTHFDIACTNCDHVKIGSGLKLKDQDEDEIKFEMVGFGKEEDKIVKEEIEEIEEIEIEKEDKEDQGGRSDTVDESEGPVFVFHGLTDKFISKDGLKYAYSDHNGVIVEILRDKTLHAHDKKSRTRKNIIEEWKTVKRQKL